LAMGKPMDLNFEIFMIVLLVLSILVVGNFLRDGESNWLEGALLVVCKHSACSLNDTNSNRSSTQSLPSLVGTTPTLTWPPPTVSKDRKWSTSL
jgi:hypothetical protein